MSKLQETIQFMKNEIDVQIHFNECWDETIFITLAEAEEWLDYLQTIINDETKLVQYRLQKVVDNITRD